MGVSFRKIVGTYRICLGKRGVDTRQKNCINFMASVAAQVG